jgi:Ca2+-binding RTX toxin-like protein
VRRAILSGLLAALLAMPASAAANNVEVGDTGRSLFVFGQPGEVNNVTVTRSGNTFRVTDSGAAISPGPGCAPVNPNQVTCNAAGVGGIKISLGDLNDVGTIGASVTPMPLDSFYDQDVEMDGDAGADVLTGGPNVDNTLNGGFDFSFTADNSPDILTGGGENDRLRGGAGNDTMSAGAGSFDNLVGGEGNDVMNGGAGNDSFEDSGQPDGADTMSGGDNIDSLRYERDAGVRVVLNGVADDGQGCPGAGCEKDNVGPDIENIQTGDGDDVIVGSPAPNGIFSADGDDTIDGGGGSDNIFSSNGADSVLGGVGDDTLSGGEDPDLLRGAAGDDRFFSSFVDDDPDNVFGGTGIDVVDYSEANSAVRVSLDNKPNDGVAGEGDNTHRDVEDVLGSQFSDSLIGSKFANQLEGGTGKDRLRGMGGADGLIGGRSADFLAAGGGKDTLDSGAGPDRLLARGGGADDLSCGSSVDKGTADRSDRLAGDCDRVKRR